MEIRIAHYPPYTSKYNPIEHRFFPHVTRACEGVVFDSVETVKTLISRTPTSKGLTTIVHILDKIYETGRKYAADFKEIMPIVFDTHLPKWNYRAIPQEQLISGSCFVLIPKSKKMRKFKRIPLTKEVQELYKMSRQHVDFTFSHIEDGYAIYLIENNETSEAKCDSRRKLPPN